MDIGMNNPRPLARPAAPQQQPPSSIPLFGTLAAILVVMVVLGLVWSGVSWVWGQVSGDTAAQQAQIEQTWYSVSASTRAGWCQWTLSGNVAGAALALEATGQGRGVTLDDSATIDFLFERCR